MAGCLKPGDILNGYEILSCIGIGGTGEVYLVRHCVLKVKRAMKILSPEKARENPNLRARFQREARIASGLDHPNLVHVFDTDTDPETGIIYIVMEYVDGCSLHEQLEGAAIPENQAVFIAVETAKALVYAAEKKIVHRDLKPANILLGNNGIVKLADMGIAQVADEPSDSSLTAGNAMVGTPSYSSPEQCSSSRDLDHRADIYSLGACLYEMMTGVPPFTGDSPFAIIEKVQKDLPVPPVQLNPAVSRKMNALILKMLSKKPKDRPQTASEVIDSLTNMIPKKGRADGKSIPKKKHSRLFSYFTTLFSSTFVPSRISIFLLLIVYAGFFLFPLLNRNSDREQEIPKSSLQEARRFVSVNFATENKKAVPVREKELLSEEEKELMQVQKNETSSQSMDNYFCKYLQEGDLSGLDHLKNTKKLTGDLRESYPKSMVLLDRMISNLFDERNSLQKEQKTIDILSFFIMENIRISIPYTCTKIYALIKKCDHATIYKVLPILKHGISQLTFTDKRQLIILISKSRIPSFTKNEYLLLFRLFPQKALSDRFFSAADFFAGRTAGAALYELGILPSGNYTEKQLELYRKLYCGESLTDKKDYFSKYELNSPFADRKYPLETALLYFPKQVQILLQMGADPNLIGITGNPVVLPALSNPKLTALLLKYHLNPELRFKVSGRKVTLTEYAKTNRLASAPLLQKAFEQIVRDVIPKHPAGIKYNTMLAPGEILHLDFSSPWECREGFFTHFLVHDGNLQLNGMHPYKYSAKSPYAGYMCEVHTGTANLSNGFSMKLQFRIRHLKKTKSLIISGGKKKRWFGVYSQGKNLCFSIGEKYFKSPVPLVENEMLSLDLCVNAKQCFLWFRYNGKMQIIRFDSPNVFQDIPKQERLFTFCDYVHLTNPMQITIDNLYVSSRLIRLSELIDIASAASGKSLPAIQPARANAFNTEYNSLQRTLTFMRPLGLGTRILKMRVTALRELKRKYPELKGYPPFDKMCAVLANYENRLR